MDLIDHMSRFVLVWGVVYAVTLALYLGFGAVFTWYARHHPERRIQPNRRGEKRMWREIGQSAWSLIATTFCLAFGLYAQNQGWALFAPFELTVWSAIGMFAVAIVAFDAWFYFAHRLMHTRVMYRFHQLHHRSVAPTVWSNYSDGLVDAFVMQSYFLWAPLILPIPPAVLVAHRLYDHFNGMIGHSGFEFFAGKPARAPSPMVCTTFHDQHHSGFRYNYANFFSFWDRVLGTLHPAYDAKVQEMEAIAGGGSVATRDTGAARP